MVKILRTARLGSNFTSFYKKRVEIVNGLQPLNIFVKKLRHR